MKFALIVGLALILSGTALILSGTVLIYVPVVSQGSHTRTLEYPPGNWYYILTENISGRSLTGMIPVSISWSSNGSMDVVAAACNHPCLNESQLPKNSTTYQNLVTSGTVALDVRNGGSIFVAWFQQTDHPPSTEFTYTVWTVQTTAPPVLLVSGSIILVLGVMAGVMSFRRVTP